MQHTEFRFTSVEDEHLQMIIDLAEKCKCYKKKQKDMTVALTFAANWWARSHLQYILDKKADQEVGLDNGKRKLRSLMDDYQGYKRRFAKDIRFDFSGLANCVYLRFILTISHFEIFQQQWLNQN